jgi:hypothetical protein
MVMNTQGQLRQAFDNLERGMFLQQKAGELAFNILL